MAQLPEDVLRYSHPMVGGTARNMAIGGAMASLGGDITAAHINPAGLALYKNAEFVLSPSFRFNKNDYRFMGSNTASDKSTLAYGTSGFVFGRNNNRYRKATSSAFSLTVNQLASYNNRVQYSGYNANSSWSEQYLEQAQRDLAGLPIGDIVRRLETNYIFGTSLAYFGFLIDTAKVGNEYLIQSQVPIARPGSGGMAILQENVVDTRGGAHEIAFSYANNYNEKFHLGFSLGIPIYNYNRRQTYREEDTSSNTNNDFSFFEYQETYTSNGAGLNGKIGIIYRPVNKVRLGFAFHTPTFASMTDRISATLISNTERYTNKPQPVTVTSQSLADPNSPAGIFNYSLTTPLRLVGSVSYVINEVKDVKKQRGFITADIEYVNQGGTRYAAGENATNDDIQYYQALNELIKDRYKGVVNLRLGGEVKFNTIMARAGFAYFSNPHRNAELKGSRMNLSGGLGYRHKGLFVDLTYVHAIINTNNVPYYLQDKPSPLALARNNGGNIFLTFGVKI
ncbi:MAG: hypothetical protein EAY75_16660 [Bacteroidetes bacterium]|nr:MAG: hypothetical protein EAY75_16660 [Bacteroidota bacterium]